MKKITLSGNLSRIGLLIFWIIVMMIYLFPFIWVIETGFRDPIDTYGWPPKFIFQPQLDAFRDLFVNKNISHFFKGSLVISLSSTLLVIAAGSPAAYALSHLKIKGKVGYLIGLLILRVVPPIALVVPVFLIASKLELVDRYPTIILVYTVFNLPFALWILRSFFRDIPDSLREAALIDGCSEFSVFSRVMLPLSFPGILTAAILTFIVCWNEFLFAFVLTGRNIGVITLAVKSFTRVQYEVLWAQIGATTFLASLPIVVFAVVMQKRLVRGLTMGAIK